MPRSRPPRTIVLHLPPLTNDPGAASSSSDNPPASGPSSASASGAEPDLEMLVVAHKLALKRGEVFNIRDFLSPERREELDAELRRVAGPSRLSSRALSAAPSAPPKALTSSLYPGSIETAPNGLAGPSSVPDPSPGLLDIPIPLTPASAPSPSPVPNTPGAPGTPTPLDPSAADGTPIHASVRKRYIPDLSGLHWKQRQKLKAQMDAEEAEAKRREEAGEPPIPASESVFAVPETLSSIGTGAWARRDKSAITPADWDKTQGNTSYWCVFPLTSIEKLPRGRVLTESRNSLLNSARKQRGPQWDYNTQSYQINRSSADYYTHRQPPRSDDDARPNPGSNSQFKTEPSDTYAASPSGLPGHAELKRKRESTDEPSLGFTAKESRGYPSTADDRVALGEAIRRISQGSQGQGQGPTTAFPAPSPSGAHAPGAGSGMGTASSAAAYGSQAGAALGTPVRTAQASGANGFSTPGQHGVPPRLSSLPPHLQAQLQAQAQAQAQHLAASGSPATATASPHVPQSQSQFHGLTPQQLAQLQNLSLPSGMNAQGVQQALAGLNGMSGLNGMNGMSPAALHGAAGQAWNAARGQGPPASGGINPAALVGAAGGAAQGFDPRELQKHIMRASGGDGPMLGGGGTWEGLNN